MDDERASVTGTNERQSERATALSSAGERPTQRATALAGAGGRLAESGIASTDDGEPLSERDTVGGVRLHCLIWGPADGPPVVLLHGLRGHAWTWERVAAGLAPPYRLYALDFRGHGDSEWAAEGYGTPRYAADVAAWL